MKIFNPPFKGILHTCSIEKYAIANVKKIKLLIKIDIYNNRLIAPSAI